MVPSVVFSDASLSSCKASRAAVEVRLEVAVVGICEDEGIGGVAGVLGVTMRVVAAGPASPATLTARTLTVS